MRDEYLAKLTFTTSLSTALKLYPLTKRDDNMINTNNFMLNMRIEFQKPMLHQALFYQTNEVPHITWLSLFSENEKMLLEDDRNFYGIFYETTVEKSRARLRRFTNKLSRIEEEKTQKAKRYIKWNIEHILEISSALDKFNHSDSITLEFMYTEWPTREEALRRNYVKEFENKLEEIATSEDSDDIPF